MTASRGPGWAVAFVLLVGAEGAAGPRIGAADSRTEVLSIRGVPQTLHLYGTPAAKAAIVTSGDGGWVHLGPEVAAFLSGLGYFVVGFDAKAYLSSFTARSGPLRSEDVPGDYGALVEYAARRVRGRPLLAGVSEGAGLSVLAAAQPGLQSRIAGVLALGLPDRNELAWRLRDSIIYLTKKTPNEPTFSVREVIAHVAPAPLALLHSTHDEFVPLAEARSLLEAARDPKRLWPIEATNHRFRDNEPQLQRDLMEALAWIDSQKGSRP